MSRAMSAVRPWPCISTAITFSGAGVFDQDLGVIRLDVGGPVPGVDHDVISVESVAALGGTLEIALINGFAPRAGDSFTILTAAWLQGTFDDVVLPPLDDGLEMSVVYHDAAGGRRASVTVDVGRALR